VSANHSSIWALFNQQKNKGSSTNASSTMHQKPQHFRQGSAWIQARRQAVHYQQ